MSNVQAGDLAYCVMAPNVGAFVRVLAPSSAPTVTPAWDCRALQPVRGMRGWCDGPLQTFPAGSIVSFADNELRPIRGQREAGAVFEFSELEVAA